MLEKLKWLKGYIFDGINLESVVLIFIGALYIIVAIIGGGGAESYPER